MRITKVKERGVKVQVYELLKGDIGRTRYREACPRLQAEGLIKIFPHRGVFVAASSYKDISDLPELRLTVEPDIAELATQRRQEGDLERFEVNLPDCAQLSKSRRSQAVPQINWNSKDFRVQVARLTNNQELIDLVENIDDKLMRTMIFAARRSPDNFSFNVIHAEIFEAILRGKGGTRAN